MKIQALVAAIVALAGSANAYSLHPASTRFEAAGSIKISGTVANVACALRLSGRTDAVGLAKITKAVFSPGDKECKNMNPAFLPWSVIAKSAGIAAIQGVLIDGGSWECGQAKVKVAVDGSGEWTASDVVLQAGCLFSATLATSPEITIVP